MVKRRKGVDQGDVAIAVERTLVVWMCARATSGIQQVSLDSEATHMKAV